VVLGFSGGPGGNTGVILKIENPNPASSFVQEQIQTIANELRSGTLVFNVLTIADELSLPSAGNGGIGYRFSIATDDPLDVTIENITRFSLQK
jgi:hypothetical protein